MSKTIRYNEDAKAYGKKNAVVCGKAPTLDPKMTVMFANRLAIKMGRSIAPPSATKAPQIAFVAANSGSIAFIKAA